MIRLLLIFVAFSANASDYYQEQRDFDAYRWEEQQRFLIEQDREDRRDHYIRNERLQDEWDRNWEEPRGD